MQIEEEMFLDPNLVLNLLLWKRDGSQFISDDACGHLATVTGALWTLRGRWFDKIDDLINCGSAASIDNIFDGGGTIEFWINPGSDGESDLGTVAEKGALGTVGWFARVAAEVAGYVDLYFAEFFNTTNGMWHFTSGAIIPINTYSHLVITYNASAVDNDPIIYLNGVSQALTESSTPVGIRVSDVSADFNLGGRGDGSRTFDGYIGEVRAYKSKILFLNKVLRNCELSKWRYQ